MTTKETVESVTATHSFSDAFTEKRTVVAFMSALTSKYPLDVTLQKLTNECYLS